MIVSGWSRVSAAMGIPFVIAYVAILNLTSDSPDDGSSDAKIMSYYGNHSLRVRGITAFFVVLAGGALFLWFHGHLRGLLSSAEGAGARGAGIAVASGTAFIFVPSWVDVLWILVLSTYLAVRPAGRAMSAAPAPM